MDKQTREMVEDIANITALQIVRPIEQRLMAIEVELKLTCRAGKARVDTRWKFVGLALAIPGWFAAAISIIRLL
jgi:hypothetical protein